MLTDIAFSFNLGVGFRVKYGMIIVWIFYIDTNSILLGQLLKAFKNLPVFRTTSEGKLL